MASLKLSRNYGNAIKGMGLVPTPLQAYQRSQAGPRLWERMWLTQLPIRRLIQQIAPTIPYLYNLLYIIVV